jgi:hypothetical protein
MTTAKIRNHRKHAFRSQRGRCYYCNCHMWLDGQGRLPFAVRFGIRPEDIYLFQCTAEHKIACQDGGKDTRANIVAACRHCNHQRHVDGAKALDSLGYAVYVALAVREQTWPTLVAYQGSGPSTKRESARATGAKRGGDCCRER